MVLSWTEGILVVSDLFLHKAATDVHYGKKKVELDHAGLPVLKDVWDLLNESSFMKQSEGLLEFFLELKSPECL